MNDSSTRSAAALRDPERASFDAEPLDHGEPAVEGLLARRYRALTIGTVALMALYAFGALAITTAMPATAIALNGLPLYALTFAGTLAASVVGMAAAGRWADARGPYAPLQHGVAWFAIGLIVAGLAPAMWVLLVGRIVQGFGGGLMAVIFYVVVGRAYDSRLHARIFAAFAGAWVLPAVIGPPISGTIVEHFGWRWVFLSVPPLAVLAAALVLPAVRDLKPLPARRTAPGAHPTYRIEWAVGAAAAVLLMHYAGQLREWSALPLLTVALIGLVACAVKVLPPGSLRAGRGLPTVIGLRAIASAAFFSAEAFLPLLLTRERGMSPASAGLMLTVGALGWSFGSWYRGRMIDPSPVRVLRVGLGCIALGVIAAALALIPEMPVAAAMSGWVVAGLGMGVVIPSLSVLLLELSPPSEQGANASALQLGDALFTAAVMALGGSLFAAAVMRAPAAAYASVLGFSVVLAAAGMLLVARARPESAGKPSGATSRNA
ncbi:MAG TPA: MFS transporter [Gammaproteobacteria bacterium]